MSDTVITGQPEKNVITEVETATVVPRTRSNAVLGDTFLFFKKVFSDKWPSFLHTNGYVQKYYVIA